MTESRTLHILLADDEEIVHQTIGDYLRESGHRVDGVRDGRAAWDAIQAQSHDLALVDVRMPGMDGLALLSEAGQLYPDLSVVIITGHANVEITIEALRLGAADFLTKPIKLIELDGVLEKSVRLGDMRREQRRLRGAIRGLQTTKEQHGADRTIVGTSSPMRHVRSQIRQAVEADCQTILITGETGTGKEVVARAIHFQACSETDPLIAVSCPAFPDSLVESELFGHVRGAFTGATEDRAGCFELADGSTVFLDEIGDLSPAAQAKLLRVLETRKLRRVGASEEISVDVRVIAATNAPLDQMVAAKKFRRDLLYRLNVYPIHLPPLRERREDIRPLAEHFLAGYVAQRGMESEGFSPEACDALAGYDFPGNARELRNVIERAVILAGWGQILPEHLHLTGSTTDGATARSVNGHKDQERARILDALERNQWNRRRAAKELDMPYSTLRYNIQKLGISK